MSNVNQQGVSEVNYLAYGMAFLAVGIATYLFNRWVQYCMGSTKGRASSNSASGVKRALVARAVEIAGSNSAKEVNNAKEIKVNVASKSSIFQLDDVGIMEALCRAHMMWLPDYPNHQGYFTGSASIHGARNSSLIKLENLNKLVDECEQLMGGASEAVKMEEICKKTSSTIRNMCVARIKIGSKRGDVIKFDFQEDWIENLGEISVPFAKIMGYRMEAARYFEKKKYEALTELLGELLVHIYYSVNNINIHESHSKDVIVSLKDLEQYKMKVLKEVICNIVKNLPRFVVDDQIGNVELLLPEYERRRPSFYGKSLKNISHLRHLINTLNIDKKDRAQLMVYMYELVDKEFNRILTDVRLYASHCDPAFVWASWGKTFECGRDFRKAEENRNKWRHYDGQNYALLLEARKELASLSS